jgi:inorganic pyrophosphatase
MNLLHSIKALENDNVVNVVVEIPKGSNEKTEYNLNEEKFVLDRVLSSNLSFPFNYGFVPETWSHDNDPLDVAIISSVTYPTGTTLQARIIGLLETIDQNGKDAKLLVVPALENDPIFTAIKNTDTLDKDSLASIEYFYKNYKINEPGKWVDINGYLSLEEAKTTLNEAIDRYHQHFQK